MYDFDHQLFLGLNFDGGPCMDRLMLTVSGTAMWLPLYALILWLVWRRGGWRGVIVFTALMIAALALSDMVSGIFKSNGPLGGLLPGFEPRWRPMFTPSLEGLDITPDSLRTLRMASRIYLGKHFPMDLVWGTLAGAILGWAAYLAYRKFTDRSRAK